MKLFLNYIVAATLSSLAAVAILAGLAVLVQVPFKGDFGDFCIGAILFVGGAGALVTMHLLRHKVLSDPQEKSYTSGLEEVGFADSLTDYEPRSLAPPECP